MLARALLVPLFMVIACTEAPTPTEPVVPKHGQAGAAEASDAAEPETVLFECTPEVGSPYNKMRVLKYDPYADEKSGGEAGKAKANAGTAESDSDGEQIVLIELNDGGQSTIGICTIVPGKPVQCKNGDASLRMQWSGKPGTTGSETVAVEEAWLFNKFIALR